MFIESNIEGLDNSDKVAGHQTGNPSFCPNIELDLIFRKSTPLMTVDFTDESNIQYISGLFPIGRLSMLIGDGSCGKSYICILASLTITSNKEFLPTSNYEVTDKEKVLLIETESRIKVYGQRITALGGNLERYGIPGEPFINLDFQSNEDKKLIEECIEDDKPKMVILDSFAGFSSVDENSAAVMPCLKWLAHLAQKHNIAIVLTQFTNKADLQNGRLTVKSVRGFTGLVQYPQIIWAIDEPDTNDRNIKRLYQIKNNIGEKEQLDYIFRLADDKATFLKAKEFETTKEKRLKLLNENKGKDIKQLTDILHRDEPNTKRDSLYKFIKRQFETGIIT